MTVMQEALWEPHTLTGRDHPASSHQAAQRVLPKTGTQRRAVYDCIRQRPFGATDDEVAAILRLSGNSVRPRRVELAEAGLIQRTGNTRKNHFGNDCDVWVVS